MTWTVHLALRYAQICLICSTPISGLSNWPIHANGSKHMSLSCKTSPPFCFCHPNWQSLTFQISFASQTALNKYMTFRMSPLICILFLPFVFFIVSDVTEVQICRLRWGFFEDGDASTRSTTPGATSRWGSRGESMVKPEISPSHEVDIFCTSSNRWSNEHSVSFTNSVVFGGLHPCLAKVFCSPVLHTWVVISVPV